MPIKGARDNMSVQFNLKQVEDDPGCWRCEVAGDKADASLHSNGTIFFSIRHFAPEADGTLIESVNYYISHQRKMKNAIEKALRKHYCFPMEKGLGEFFSKIFVVREVEVIRRTIADEAETEVMLMNFKRMYPDMNIDLMREKMLALRERNLNQTFDHHRFVVSMKRFRSSRDPIRVELHDCKVVGIFED